MAGPARSQVVRVQIHVDAPTRAPAQLLLAALTIAIVALMVLVP